jgi:MFS family permease
MKNLELILEWLGIQFCEHWWWLISLLLLWVAFWVSRSPKSKFGKILLEEHIEARITDYASEKGPILEERHKKNLLALRATSSKVMQARDSTLYWSNRLYNQKSLNINGFDRALLIAFVYPLSFILIEWFFKNDLLSFGGRTLSEGLPLFIKISFIFIGTLSFFWFKYAPIWLDTKLSLLNIKPLWVKKVTLEHSALIGALIAIAIGAIGFIVIDSAVAYALVTADLSTGYSVSMVAIKDIELGTSYVKGAGPSALNIAVALIGAYFAFGFRMGFGAGLGAIFIAIGLTINNAGYLNIALLTPFVVASTILLYIADTINKRCKHGFRKILLSIFSCFICVVFAAVTVIYTPYWLNFFISFKLSETAFIFGFFLCLMPLVNGFSDWLSVSFTQFCLSKYSTENSYKWYMWLLFDSFLAIVFSAFLFFSVFSILDLMQQAGWRVNSVAIKNQIYNDLQEVDSFFGLLDIVFTHLWLFGLLITNLIPTCAHLIFVVKAHLIGYFSPVRTDIDDLLIRARIVDAPSTKYKEDDFKWSAVEAEKVALYVSGLPRVNGLVFASLIIPFLYLIFLFTSNVIVWLVK